MKISKLIIAFLCKTIGRDKILHKIRNLEFQILNNSASCEARSTSEVILAPYTNPMDSIKHENYNSWFQSAIRNAPIAPGVLLATTFSHDSKYGELIVNGMFEAEKLFVQDLIVELKENNICGDIVEFGVFEGRWIEILYNASDAAGYTTTVYGFDSFAGLPKLSESDLDCWHEGQYAASFEEVSRCLKCAERPNVKLIKGWFSDSFQRQDVQALQKISYARIDSDLYAPALECLNFLKDRLVDGAILVFDDWYWLSTDKGETKAFAEWLPTSGITLEFWAYNFLGHLYLKVHRH